MSCIPWRISALVSEAFMVCLRYFRWLITKGTKDHPIHKLYRRLESWAESAQIPRDPEPSVVSFMDSCPEHEPDISGSCPIKERARQIQRILNRISTCAARIIDRQENLDLKSGFVRELWEARSTEDETIDYDPVPHFDSIITDMTKLVGSLEDLSSEETSSGEISSEDEASTEGEPSATPETATSETQDGL